MKMKESYQVIVYAVHARFLCLPGLVMLDIQCL
jgi:hypothetical protein